MKKERIIFVPPTEVKEDEYQEIVNWAFDNITHNNVISLDDQDVLSLQYESEILDIINELNDGMLQLYEDDWIFDLKIKSMLKEQLSIQLLSISNARITEIVKGILGLLDISIKTGKNLYFHF